MSPEQLALFGHDLDASSPWQLLAEEPPPRRARRADGVVRVLRELDRRGLDPGARVAAAALVLGLDEEAER
jgi:hypothetical protein